jgi:hypothetical protein
MLRAGEEQPFRVVAYDAQGNAVADAAIRVGGPRMAVWFGDGVVRGLQAGRFTAVATWSPTERWHPRSRSRSR